MFRGVNSRFYRVTLIRRAQIGCCHSAAGSPAQTGTKKKASLLSRLILKAPRGVFKPGSHHDIHQLLNFQAAQSFKLT